MHRHRVFLVLAALIFVVRDEPFSAQTALSISTIQGAGPRSPREGQIVTTTGIVTGRKTNGFYVQSPDNATDGDARTSEGMFVFTGTAPAANITPGTMVTVTGRVLEFVPAADPSSPPLTELGESPTVVVGGAGASLPAPIEIRAGDVTASGGHDQLERLENMRVRVASLTVVAPTLGSVSEANATATSNGVFYGVISGAARPFREPGIDARQPLPPGTPCCVPRFDGNPERLRVDSDGQPGAPPLDVASGSIIQNLVGPLDYGFQSYTVLPDPGSALTISLAGIPGAVRPAAAEELSVAWINLQRFFDNTDDRQVGDAVLTTAAFQLRLTKTSSYVRSILQLPDVIAVGEVENLATLQTLAAAVNRDVVGLAGANPDYVAYLEEGNDPGGIDVGVLVKRSRVEVLEFRQEGPDEMFRATPASAPELLNDRPPLLIGVRVTNAGNAQLRVSILVNHLRSLIDIEDTGPTGARVRAKRAAQAEFAASLIGRRLADNPNEHILVVGDMNAFEFNDGYVDVTGTLRGTPAPRDQVVVETRDAIDPDLADLMTLLPRDQRYSYVFDGTAQAIDHMLATEGLRARVSLFSYIRGNADAPEVWRSDPRRPERISDHDAAIAYFRFAR
jgi:predicted extracellular nuclease